MKCDRTQHRCVVGELLNEMCELHSGEGSNSVPEKLASASAGNAAIEKNVREILNVVRFLDVYIEWCTVPRLTLIVRFWPEPWRPWDVWSADDSGEWTACERRQRRNWRKA